MATHLPSPTFGIEEEFFLVDPETRELCGERTTALLSACRARLGDRVREEPHRAQIEIATPVLHTASMAYESLHDLRQAVERIAHKFDLRPVAAGTHPSVSWRTQEPPRESRLDGTRLEGRHLDGASAGSAVVDHAAFGRRLLACGLHVHVGVPDGVDRIALIHRMLPWLPLFLALSCSSPVLRTGRPDTCTGDTEGGCHNHDGSDVRWALRPSPRFPTLELRICDACTRIDDTLALASAFRCLVRAHLRDPRLGEDAPPRIVDEHRWRANRHGLFAQFIGPETGRAEDMAAATARLGALIAPDVAALRCEREIEHLLRIPGIGTSADAQMAIYRQERDALRSHGEAAARVTDWLIETTAGVGDDMRMPLRLAPAS